MVLCTLAGAGVHTMLKEASMVKSKKLKDQLVIKKIQTRIPRKILLSYKKQILISERARPGLVFVTIHLFHDVIPAEAGIHK